MYDLVIIGASAAGSAAAIYVARRNLNFLVIAKDTGGEVALSGEVENWPGGIHTTGIELSKQFTNHAKAYNVKIEEGYDVLGITQADGHHVVHAKDILGKDQTYPAKTVIIATGIHPRELNAEGEAALKGRGVTYCTVCDGPLFKGKTTATVGSGNSALESALMMAGIAKKVYLLSKYAKEEKNGFPKGEDILVQKVNALANVEIMYRASTTKITGNGLVQGLTYRDDATQEEKHLAVDGVMVHIGAIPNSQFVDCVKKTPGGDIEIDLLCKTSCLGIFAAGDVTNIPYKQIAIAAGQGVVAALTAIDYINKWKE